VDRPRRETVYVAPPPPVVVIEEDYVYYPHYQVYYSPSRHHYAYREGRAWVAQPAPRGVTINALQASPSVHMTFRGPPAQHHVEVIRQYPKNWRPSDGRPGEHGRDHDRR